METVCTFNSFAEKAGVEGFGTGGWGGGCVVGVNLMGIRRRLFFCNFIATPESTVKK